MMFLKPFLKLAPHNQFPKTVKSAIMVLLKDFLSWRENSSLDTNSTHRKTKYRESLYVENVQPVVSTAPRKIKFQKGHYLPTGGIWVGGGRRGGGCLCFNKCESSPPQGQCEAYLDVSRYPLRLFLSEKFPVDQKESQTWQKVMASLG